MPVFSIYKIGASGVNVSKSPLQLANDELTAAQNAEFLIDPAIGGEGALSKRGGLATLTSALAGDILGIHPLPLLTTYARTLHAARGSENSNTFMTSTNGSTWTNTSTPTGHADGDKYTDENNERDARRLASFKNFLVYAGNNYTQDTDPPTVILWDGTASVTAGNIGPGPTGNASPAFAITDVLAANGKVYMAVHDPGGAAPNLAGRVLQYDPVTGKITQVLNGFGGGTGEVAGGAPSALAFYQGQLWVGLNTGNTTDAIGKIVRAYPDVDTTWTSDVANLRQSISTLAVFKGDLYAGTQSSASAGATITRRSATTGTWTTQVTSAGGASGNGHYASFLVDGATAIYAVEYHATTPIIHILRSTDGTTWSTDRDVDANDGGITGNLPGSSIFYDDNDAFYFVFRATTTAGTNGFIMERSSGGVYTKRNANTNMSGPIGVLVQRT